MTLANPLPFICALTLCACAQAPADLQPPDPAPDLANIVQTFDGRCFASTPAVTTTALVTEQVMVIPETVAPDGTVTAPAVFRNETRPVTKVIAEGQEFETLCADEFTPERVSTLQRALRARLAYTGPITGLYDGPTQAAVQAFQTPEGFNSPQIARVVAQRLGLVPFGSEQTNAFQDSQAEPVE